MLVKRDLIKYIAEKRGIQVSTCKTIVEDMFEDLKEFLLEKKELRIKGFGRFALKEVENKKWVYQKTGEEFPCQPYKKITFKGIRIKGGEQRVQDNG